MPRPGSDRGAAIRSSALPAELVGSEVGLIVGHRGSTGRSDLVQPPVFLLGEHDAKSPQVVLELLHRSRSDDGARDAWLVLAPAERYLPRCTTFLFGYGLHYVEHVEGLLGQGVASSAPRLELVAGSLRGLFAPPVLTGQETASKGRPRYQGDPICLGDRDKLSLYAPIKEVVGWLLADEAVQPQLLGCPQGLDHLPGGEGAGADVEHLAG